jgi:hypothetical protein
MQINKDEIVMFSHGEYSDYCVCTICKAKKDFDQDELLSEYISLNPEQKQDYEFNKDKFLSWLIVDKDVFDEIAYNEWHIDDSFTEMTSNFISKGE